MDSGEADDYVIKIDISFIYRWWIKHWTSIKQTGHRYYILNPPFFNLIFGLFFITFFCLYPLIFYNSPYSLYWIPKSNMEIVQEATTLNQQRYISAKNYLKPIKKNSVPPNLDIVIGVITVKRNIGNRALGYLTQVMAQLDVAVERNNFYSSVHVFICDTYAGPGPHTEADLLGHKFDRKQRFAFEDPGAVIMDRYR